MGGAGDGEGAGSESPPSGARATLNIRCANGAKFTLQADLGETVGAFKEVVAGSCDVPAPQQRLIYKGRILKDEQTLESYGVETDHTIHLLGVRKEQHGQVLLLVPGLVQLVAQEGWVQQI
uniref:Uncharacterized protein n=1 Tax=Aegilops tauschii TaxID=37682 RepID=N1R1W2_AEGTA